VSFFFDDLPDAAPVPAAGLAETRPPYNPGPPVIPGIGELGREELELMRAYHDIPDPKLRRQVYNLAKALADTLRKGGE
jgi:hypothetical protein